MARKKPEELRSHRWFGESDMRGFGHHSRTGQMGYSRADYLGKPIIAIINTWSDINACHSHFRQRADEVKRGVLQAGGFPLEMPAMALAEVFQKPTAMLYRNLLAMETEELLRSYPVDGCVLMGGCDKTTPALLMGALSMNLRRSFCPPARCCPDIFAIRSSAAAPMCGSSGRRSVPAISVTNSGTASRKGSRGRPDTA